MLYIYNGIYRIYTMVLTPLSINRSSKLPTIGATIRSILSWREFERTSITTFT